MSFKVLWKKKNQDHQCNYESYFANLQRCVTVKKFWKVKLYWSKNKILETKILEEKTDAYKMELIRNILLHIYYTLYY